MRRRIRQNTYFALFILLLFFYFGFYIGKIFGFVIFPDEFGYWFYAAGAAGYDWSHIVSLGSYYSFGYSLILTPIFILFTDAVAAYRVAVAVNFILLAGSGYLLIRLLQRLSENLLNTQKTTLFAILGVLYPSNLFYAKTTLTETLLMFAFVTVCYVFCQYLHTGKRSLLTVAILLAAYMYMVHMRSLAIVAAMLFTLLIRTVRKSEKSRYFMVIGIIAVLLFFISCLLRMRILDSEFITADEVLLNANGMKGQIPKLMSILSAKGTVELLQSLAGKLLYMGMATFGLAYWGLYDVVSRFVKLRRQREQTNYYFYLFLLVAVIGQIGITTVYNIHPSRADGVIYGRYHEYIFPILIALGAMRLSEMKHPFRNIMLICAAQLMFLLSSIQYIECNQLTKYEGYFALGMSYVSGIGEFEPTTFLVKAYICGVALTVVVSFGIWIADKAQMRHNLLWLILALEIVLSVRTSSLYTDYYNRYAQEDAMLAQKIDELQNADNRRIVYIDSYEMPIIGAIQFHLRDSAIDILDERGQLNDYTEEELQTTDLVLIAASEEYRNKLMERYDQSMTYGHFTLLYNE